MMMAVAAFLRAPARAALQTAAKMTAQLADSESARDMSERMIALGRLGGAANVARAVAFLLHPDSSYITGTAPPCWHVHMLMLFRDAFWTAKSVPCTSLCRHFLLSHDFAHAPAICMHCNLPAMYCAV
jgi:hypothetical protein